MKVGKSTREGSCAYVYGNTIQRPARILKGPPFLLRVPESTPLFRKFRIQHLLSKVANSKKPSTVSFAPSHMCSAQLCCQSYQPPNKHGPSRSELCQDFGHLTALRGLRDIFRGPADVEELPLGQFAAQLLSGSMLV